MEKELPNRRKLLIAMEEPTEATSTIDNADPSLAKLRKESEAPKHI